jgi:3-oxoacyl-[acyl-carrier protein] reductase
MDLNLTNKNVLVTGGSRGIGKAIVEAFVSEGAKVAITSRNNVELEGITHYIGDLTKAQDRLKLINKFQEDFGSLDILINNVGGSNGGEALDTDLSLFKEAMDLNFFSAVELSQIAGRHMKEKQSGVIVNISSIFGRESGGKITYNAAKSALISFTKGFSTEMIKYGVRVNGVAPGSILHPTGNWQRRLAENPEKINQFIEQEIPAGRFGTVEEIANVVVFLASDKASWLVGATLNVDGGQSRANF